MVIQNLESSAPAPAIKSSLNNLITEIVGTFVLVLGALLMSKPDVNIRRIRCIARCVTGIGYWIIVGWSYRLCY